MVSVSCQDLLPSLTSPSLLESLASALQCRMPPSLLPGCGGDRTCCHPEGSGHVLAGSTGHTEGVPLSSAKGEPPKAQLTEAQLRLPDFCLSQDFIPTLEEISLWASSAVPMLLICELSRCRVAVSSLSLAGLGILENFAHFQDEP